MITVPDKVAHLLAISDEILNNLDSADGSLEKTILKCKKLARLRDDLDALGWFTVELHGYGRDIALPGIDPRALDRYAERSGRCQTAIDKATGKEVTRYWSASIAELEAGIESDRIALNNLIPPQQYTPATSASSTENQLIGKSSYQYVIEKYADVLVAIREQQHGLSESIKTRRTLLAKIRNNIYSYVMQVNLQLRFESVTESIFQKTKEAVDKQLSHTCPGALQKFVAAYERLHSENPEEWSQAMSSCRNILKEYADVVFPASGQKYRKKSGEELVVTDDKHKNRLIAFIDKYASGDRNKFLSARVSDLESRIHYLNDLLSRGTHVGMGVDDVRICVLDTYFLIGSLLSLGETHMTGRGDR